ncbi:MAG: TetR family transcriptional regulator, partial [Candidatus Dadabacteria bacterium]|nr:TetR family transcriptional regulator [Candidatus Dadabacteria bacterium]
IDSAIQLLGNRSYNSVGVQELCEHAEVKKGSFYHFFPSKRDLTIVALDTIWENFKNHMLVPVLESDLEPLEKMKTLMNDGYNHLVQSKSCSGCISGCNIGNLAVELSTQDEEIRKKIESIFDEWIALIEVLIQDAISRGQISPKINVRATAQSLLAFVEGALLVCKTYNDPDVMKNMSDNAFSILRVIK